MTHGFFFPGNQKKFPGNFRERPGRKELLHNRISGSSREISGKFPASFREISQELKFFPNGAAARSQEPDAPKGIQMHGHPFDAADNWRIWYRGPRVRLASLRSEDNPSLRIPGAPVSAAILRLISRRSQPDFVSPLATRIRAENGCDQFCAYLLSPSINFVDPFVQQLEQGNM